MATAKPTLPRPADVDALSPWASKGSPWRRAGYASLQHAGRAARRAARWLRARHADAEAPGHIRRAIELAKETRS